MIHNPQHYARDFYFFKRSQYPQLALVHKKPSTAYNELQKQCFGLKFVEMGKVMLTWGVLKNVNQVVQRVVFLHEDLMKLPSFPRKALEAELDLYANGQMGKVSTIKRTSGRNSGSPPVDLSFFPGHVLRNGRNSLNDGVHRSVSRFPSLEHSFVRSLLRTLASRLRRRKR